MSLEDILSKLPTPEDMGRQARQKPARGTTKRARRTKRAGRGKAFRDAVWHASDLTCADCSRFVVRTLDIEAPHAGHVHHIQLRSTSPALKYDPNNAMILCSRCHVARHGR